MTCLIIPIYKSTKQASDKSLIIHVSEASSNTRLTCFFRDFKHSKTTKTPCRAIALVFIFSLLFATANETLKLMFYLLLLKPIQPSIDTRLTTGIPRVWHGSKDQVDIKILVNISVKFKINLQ